MKKKRAQTVQATPPPPPRTLAEQLRDEADLASYMERRLLNDVLRQAQFVADRFREISGTIEREISCTTSMRVDGTVVVNEPRVESLGRAAMHVAAWGAANAHLDSLAAYCADYAAARARVQAFIPTVVLPAMEPFFAAHWPADKETK